MNDNSVYVKNLTKKFGSFTAVDDLSFSVKKGEIYGFLGPNGAGKSTTIRMLSGLLVPSSGIGTVSGFDIHKDSEKIKAKIGYVSQKFSLYKDLTVEENINFYAGIYKVPYALREKRKEWVLEMADLKSHRNELTESLSGGWKQKLSLGCAILHEPSILFLDEPTSGVDPINRRRFWNIIYDLADHGMTIFVTTHYMDEAEYVDSIAFIYRGRLIAKGPPEQLKNDAIKGLIVEITTFDPQGISDQARALPFVKDAILFGKRVHVYLKDGFVDIKILFKHLNSALPIQMEAIDPTMEDVFITLIERTDLQEKGSG